MENIMKNNLLKHLVKINAKKSKLKSLKYTDKPG